MAKRYWLWKGKAFCSLRKENHFLWEKKMSPTSLLSKTINTDINKSLPKRRQHCAQFHSQHIYLWEENLLFSSFISGSLPLRRCKNKEKKSVARAAEKCWWGTFHQLYNTQTKVKARLWWSKTLARNCNKHKKDLFVKRWCVTCSLLC